jgi:hypothetical protein
MLVLRTTYRKLQVSALGLSRGAYRSSFEKVGQLVQTLNGGHTNTHRVVISEVLHSFLIKQHHANIKGSNDNNAKHKSNNNNDEHKRKRTTITVNMNASNRNNSNRSTGAEMCATAKWAFVLGSPLFFCSFSLGTGLKPILSSQRHFP